MSKSYRTSITTHVDGKPYVYGYDLTKLAGEVSFARAIYLILKGEMPDKNSQKIFEAILTISLDHGLEPPSVVAARNIYSGGSPVQAAVAGGILALGEYHGGAIEAAMENFLKYCPPASQRGEPAGTGVDQLIDDFAKSGLRIAGFGHRLYEVDPRTTRLVAIAKDLGFYGKYVKFAQNVEDKLSKGGKRLPLNIDGIIAALLLEMDFNPKFGKGIFIIARTSGLVAHVVEEALREKPFRRLSESDVEYDGPRPRK